MGTVIGAIIGAAVGWLTAFLQLRLEQRKLYAKAISANRMDWINNFREEFSIVVGTARACSIDGRSGTVLVWSAPAELLIKAEEARAKLLTRLNLDTTKEGNEYNQKFCALLSNLNFANRKPEQLEELTRLSRKILEYEWTRVKQEAEGEK